MKTVNEILTEVKAIEAAYPLCAGAMGGLTLMLSKPGKTRASRAQTAGYLAKAAGRILDGACPGPFEPAGMARLREVAKAICGKHATQAFCGVDFWA